MSSPGLSRDSALAAGIPGEPAGFAHLAKKYGKLPLSVSMAPAIKLAREGFPLYERLRGAVAFKKNAFLKTPMTPRACSSSTAKCRRSATSSSSRSSPPASSCWPRKGADGYYKGAFAKKLVAGVQQLGGNWTEADLANYKVVERPPVVGHYRGARIVSGSPPTSGGIALIDALNILEGFDLDKVDTVTRTHLIVEAMRRVHRDRAVYLGDPDFVDVPVARLINEYYAAGQRASIRMDKATPSSIAARRRCAAGRALNYAFLGDRRAGQHGRGHHHAQFLLRLRPHGARHRHPAEQPDGRFLGEARRAEWLPADRRAKPMRSRRRSGRCLRRRPRSSKGPKGLMIIGSPGGSCIPGMVILGTLNFMDGKSAQEIVSAPRFHHQFSPDVLEFETGRAQRRRAQAQLEARGHMLREGSRKWGNTQVVTWDYKTGKVEAASDPRGVGEGLVY